MLIVARNRLVGDDFRIQLFDEELYCAYKQIQKNFDLSKTYMEHSTREVKITDGEFTLFILYKHFVLDMYNWEILPHGSVHIILGRDDFAKVKKWLFKIFTEVDYEKQINDY